MKIKLYFLYHFTVMLLGFLSGNPYWWSYLAQWLWRPILSDKMSFFPRPFHVRCGGFLGL